MNSLLQNQCWPLLEAAALRGTLLLLLGAVLIGCARRNFALRHRIGVLTFAALLLLPLFNVVLPPLNLDIYSRNARSSPTASQPPSAFPADDIPPLKIGSSPTQSQTPDSTSIFPVPASTSRPEIASELLLLVWVVGMLFVSTRTFVGLAAMRRLQTRESQRLTSGPLHQQCVQLAHQVGIRRPVTLLLAQNPEVALPMTWGWRSSHLPLPTQALDWPAERLRSVLLHELSHIRRCDWAAQSLAAFVCALYWFHPLVWWANNRLKADAENATDERVVALGVKASDYCSHLLELARLASRGQGKSAYAVYGVPMARGANIEGRLRLLLDTRRPRRAQSKFSTALLLASFAGTFALISILQPRIKAQPRSIQAPMNGPSAYAVKVPGGGTVSLVGVSSRPYRNKFWWSPTGITLPNDAFITGGATVAKDPRYKTREFVASLRGISPGASWRWKTEPGTSWAGAQVRRGQSPSRSTNELLTSITSSVPKDLGEITIKLAVANGHWSTAARSNPQSGSSNSANGSQISFTRGAEQKGKATVTVTHTIFSKDVRLVAVDTGGKQHVASSSESAGNDVFYQLTSSFQIPLSRVQYFQLQTRSFHWVTFPRVKLNPVLEGNYTRTVPLTSLKRETAQPHHSGFTLWQTVTPGVRVGISAGDGGGAAHNDIPVYLHLVVSKGTVLPQVDWNKAEFTISHPFAKSKIAFGDVDTTGWKPTKQPGMSMSMVRHIRVEPKGVWGISTRIPVRIEGKTTHLTFPMYQVEVK